MGGNKHSAASPHWSRSIGILSTQAWHHLGYTAYTCNMATNPTVQHMWHHVLGTDSVNMQHAAMSSAQWHIINPDTAIMQTVCAAAEIRIWAAVCCQLGTGCWLAWWLSMLSHKKQACPGPFHSFSRGNCGHSESPDNVSYTMNMMIPVHSVRSGWHWWLSRRGRRAGKFSWAPRQSLHSLQHGDQCWED